MADYLIVPERFTTWVSFDRSLVRLVVQKQDGHGLPMRLVAGPHYVKHELCKRKLQSMTRFGG